MYTHSQEREKKKTIRVSNVTCEILWRNDEFFRLAQSKEESVQIYSVSLIRLWIWFERCVDLIGVRLAGCIYEIDFESSHYMYEQNVMRYTGNLNGHFSIWWCMLSLSMFLITLTRHSLYSVNRTSTTTMLTNTHLMMETRLEILEIRSILIIIIDGDCFHWCTK